MDELGLFFKFLFYKGFLENTKHKNKKHKHTKKKDWMPHSNVNSSSSLLYVFYVKLSSGFFCRFWEN